MVLANRPLGQYILSKSLKLQPQALFYALSEELWPLKGPFFLKKKSEISYN